MNGQSTVVSKTLVSEKPVPHSATLVRTKAAYGDTEAYYARMGVKPAIMPILRAAPPDGMTWLHAGDLLSTGLATEMSDDRDLQPGRTGESYEFAQELPNMQNAGFG